MKLSVAVRSLAYDTTDCNHFGLIKANSFVLTCTVYVGCELGLTKAVKLRYLYITAYQLS